MGHDWGSAICWAFVERYKHMVHKYVMMGAPSAEVFLKLLRGSDQFKRSWYTFFFKMPCLPELMLSTSDYAIFRTISKNRENYTEEDIEAFKFTFSKTGQWAQYAHTQKRQLVFA